MFSVTLAVQSKAGGRACRPLQILGDTIRQRVALVTGQGGASEAQPSPVCWQRYRSSPGLALYLRSLAILMGCFTKPTGQNHAINGGTVTLTHHYHAGMIRRGNYRRASPDITLAVAVGS